jgi:hypothetical protein|mmetsp:Transcript_33544/g.91876  ORF Transcript_33544/g.91876 Transcript_33544/m.91876 type:complete len:130 (+) Transcript_33544:204-593(+)|eukprot:5569402-Prymnesium_polylepis.1
MHAKHARCNRAALFGEPIATRTATQTAHRNQSHHMSTPHAYLLRLEGGATLKPQQHCTSHQRSACTRKHFAAGAGPSRIRRRNPQHSTVAFILASLSPAEVKQRANRPRGMQSSPRWVMNNPSSSLETH